MAREATAATMRIISNALFSGDERLTSAEAMAHIAAALGGVSEARLQVLLNLPMIPVSLRGYRGRRGQIYLRRTLTELVRERLAGDAPDDFVTNMIRALRERFPAEEAIELAVDNAATFYLAGHETTANAVTWTLYLLPQQPELQEPPRPKRPRRLAAGVDSALPDRLPLLRMIVEESLRLYPPAPRFDREAIAADRLGEHEVGRATSSRSGRGCSTATSKLWDDPDAFDHTRFAPERKGERHRFQYHPVRRRPADVRRRALRDGRGADHPRRSGSPNGASRRCRATRQAVGSGDPAAGRTECRWRSRGAELP